MELSVAAPLMARGQIRAIGISAPKRDTAWPDLPTVAEQGVPGYEITSWFGFFTSAGYTGTFHLTRPEAKETK